MSIDHLLAGNGPALLLLHGLGGERCVWEPLIDELAVEHRVLAVDLPGFGRSDALPSNIAPTPAALALAVAAFLDEQGVRRAHLVGNSLGAWIALELAKLGRAQSVVGLCPAGLWSRPLQPADKVTRGRAHRLVRRFRPLVPVAMLSPRVRRLALSPFVAHPERVPYHAAWRMISSYGRSTAYDATSNAMRSNAFDDPARVAVPVTLAFGERDRLVRPVSAGIPGARTVVMPDCGHIPMWDDPSLVLAIIRDTVEACSPTAAAS